MSLRWRIVPVKFVRWAIVAGALHVTVNWEHASVRTDAAEIGRRLTSECAIACRRSASHLETSARRNLCRPALRSCCQLDGPRGRRMRRRRRRRSVRAGRLPRHLPAVVRFPRPPESAPDMESYMCYCIGGVHAPDFFRLASTSSSVRPILTQRGVVWCIPACPLSLDTFRNEDSYNHGAVRLLELTSAFQMSCLRTAIRMSWFTHCLPVFFRWPRMLVLVMIDCWQWVSVFTDQHDVKKKEGTILNPPLAKNMIMIFFQIFK